MGYTVVKRTCEYCGQEYKRTTQSINVMKYCSRSCASKANWAKPNRPLRQKWTPEMKAAQSDIVKAAFERDRLEAQNVATQSL